MQDGAFALSQALKTLPIATNRAFQRVASDRLTYLGEDGTPDAIDRFSAALACSSLRSAEPSTTLIVFPDDVKRRGPLLFATALVMDAVAAIEASGADRCVLYFSTVAGVRTQLACVRLRDLSLSGVFGQQYGRGRAEELQITRQTAGVNLPSVICIYAPADPAALLRMHRPAWVAVDCGDSNHISWLGPLLREAKRLGICAIGWSRQPLSDSPSEWLASGGGVLRWPRLRHDVKRRIENLEALEESEIHTVVTPRVLSGGKVRAISCHFAAACEALLDARSTARGRLNDDAVSTGWRLLRALEGLPVPLEVYEREARSYWGTPPIAELELAFERFAEAVQQNNARLYACLVRAQAALNDVIEELKKGDTPIWQGLANLCVEIGGPRRVVFSSRAKREMFSFCMLAKFNVSEDDLRELGISLTFLSALPNEQPGPSKREYQKCEARLTAPLLVGLPGRHAEHYLIPLLTNGILEVLLWPHQERLFERRVAALDASLALGWANLEVLQSSEHDLRNNNAPGQVLQGLKIGPQCEMVVGSPNGPDAEILARRSLWRSPDTADAIASLFATDSTVSDDGIDDSVVSLAVRHDALGDATDSWVASALELRLEGSRRVLLAEDETVNVVAKGIHRLTIEERFVRALRVGDELLFIHGQRRQSLYDLLVSRVHRDPLIAQYIALVQRWQDDFILSVAQNERKGLVTPESLLGDLRERGSSLTSPQTLRSWLRRLVLAPADAEDLRRVAEALELPFVRQYYLQIHRAARRLHGLHISLSARLNRWLASSDGDTLLSPDDAVIDSELDLRVDDFRDSILRLRVLAISSREGPFYRSSLGELEDHS